MIKPAVFQIPIDRAVKVYRLFVLDKWYQQQVWIQLNQVGTEAECGKGNNSKNNQFKLFPILSFLQLAPENYSRSYSRLWQHSKCIAPQHIYFQNFVDD